MTDSPRLSPADFRLVLLFLLLLLFASSGCNSVYSAKPMGKNPVPLSPKEWDGTWIAVLEAGHENGVPKPFLLKVIDEKQGILRAAAIAVDNADFTLQTATIHIRQKGNTLFASRLANPDADRYVWGMIFKTSGRIVMWLPIPEKFGKLVKDGTLPGLAYSVGEGEDVLLDELNDQQMDLIVRIEDLFLPGMPFVYTRLIDEISPVALAVTPVKVEPPHIDTRKLLDAEVRWVGTVANEVSKEVPGPGGPSGTQAITDKPPRMAKATTKIPARKGERFGIGYVLKGAPEGSYAGIREIWRFPEPGLTNPETGTTEREHVTRKILVVTDEELFSGWALLYEWELVPGTWTFELWTGDRLLLRQLFEVVRP